MPFDFLGSRCITDKYGGGTNPGDACLFPFMYQGVTYYVCANVGNNGVPWCATSYHKNSIQALLWGECRNCRGKKGDQNCTFHMHTKQLHQILLYFS